MNKNKGEDFFKSIQKADKESEKKKFCLKQIDFFKCQMELPDYNYDEFILIIEDLEKSKNIELNKIWICLMNEIVRLNPSYLQNYTNIVLKKIFHPSFSDNDFKDIKIKSISIFTNKCNNLTKNENLNQEILIFLVLECLINRNNLEILNLIDNYMHYYHENNLTLPFYYEELIIEIYCKNIISDYLNNDLKNSNNEDNKELNSENNDNPNLELYELLSSFISHNKLISSTILNYILIVFCFKILKKKDEILYVFNNLLNNHYDKTMRLLLNLLNMQNFNFVETFEKLNIFENIDGFFISDFIEKNKDKYNLIYQNYQIKFQVLKETFKNNINFVIIGSIKLFEYILNEKFKDKEDFQISLVYINFLEGLNHLVNLNNEQIDNTIAESLSIIIINHGGYFYSEWEIVFKIINNYIKDKNEKKKRNYEKILFSIVELYLMRKYLGNKEILFNLLFSFKDYENVNLSIISIVNKLKIKKNFEKYYNEIILEIPNYLNSLNEKEEKIQTKKIIIVKYILSYLLVYSIKDTNLIENIIFSKFQLLTSSFFPYSNILKLWSKIILNILVNTNNKDIFQCIITYSFSLVNDEKYNIFTSKLMSKIFPRLSKTFQFEKINFIFEYLKNYLENTEKIDTQFFLSIIEILDNSFYTNDDKLILGKLSNKTKNDLKKIYKYPILNNSFIMLKNRNNIKSAFFDISFIYGFLIMKLNDEMTDIAFKERILLFFANKVSDFFFFKNIELTPLVNYIIKLSTINFEKYLERKNSIKYMINILINTSFNLAEFNNNIIIRNSNIIKFQIIEYSIKTIETLGKRALEIIMKDYKLKEQKPKSVVSLPSFLNFKKFSSSTNDLKDNHIIIENLLYYLYNYLILLENYLYLLGCRSNRKNSIKEKTQIANFSVIEIDENALPEKYFSLLNKVFELIIEIIKIAQYKEKFILHLLKFFYVTEKYFLLCGENSITLVIYILLNIVFPSFSKKWYNSFSVEFHISFSDEFKKMEFKSKKMRLNQEIQFFGKQLIIYYFSSAENIFPKIKKIIQNVLPKNNDNNLFLELCQMNTFFHTKNVDEIPNLKSDSNIYLNDKSYIKVYENKTTIFVNSISEKCLNIKRRKNNLKKENINLLTSLLKVKDENIKIEKPSEEDFNQDSILEIKNIINPKTNSYKLCDKDNLIKFQKFEENLHSLPLTRIINISYTGIDYTMKYPTKNDFYKFSKDSFHIYYEKFFLSNGNSNKYKSIDGINTLNFNILNEKSNEQICIVFVNNIKTKYISEFFTEFLPSKNILIYIVINMLSESHWKIQILYNLNPDKEKIISKIRKKINKNFPEELIIYIDPDYKYISLYLHKIIVIINIIINRVIVENKEFKFSIYSERYNLFNDIQKEF